MTEGREGMAGDGGRAAGSADGETLRHSAQDAAMPGLMPVDACRALDHVRGGIPEELICAPALARVRAMASALPPLTAPILECRLASDAAEVDLGLTAPVAGGHREALARWLASDAPARETPAGAAWARVGEMVARWADPDGGLGAVDAIVLEWDLAEDAGEPAPNLHLRFPGWREDGRPEGDVSPESVLAAVGAAFTPLFGYAPSPAVERCLSRCLKRLPDGARVAYAGLNSLREPPGLKLYLAGIPTPAVPEYLGAVGWHGHGEAMVRVLQAVPDLGDWHRLVLDLWEDVWPSVGWECYLAPPAAIEPRWRPVLDRLVALGLCTCLKRDALMAWMWMNTPRQPAAGSFFPGQPAYYAWRRINHLKLVCRPDGSLECKAYLTYGAGWVQGGGAKAAPLGSAAPAPQ